MCLRVMGGGSWLGWEKRGGDCIIRDLNWLSSGSRGAGSGHLQRWDHGGGFMSNWHCGWRGEKACGARGGDIGIISVVVARAESPRWVGGGVHFLCYWFSSKGYMDTPGERFQRASFFFFPLFFFLDLCFRKSCLLTLQTQTFLVLYTGILGGSIVAS